MYFVFNLNTMEWHWNGLLCADVPLRNCSFTHSKQWKSDITFFNESLRIFKIPILKSRKICILNLCHFHRVHSQPLPSLWQKQFVLSNHYLQHWNSLQFLLVRRSWLAKMCCLGAKSKVKVQRMRIGDSKQRVLFAQSVRFKVSYFIVLLLCFYIL